MGSSSSLCRATKIREQKSELEIKDLFDAILKRADEAKAHGIRPRLSRSRTEYVITIPQGYKTRLYKIIIIQQTEGVSIQTYDRGKMQYDEKLPETTMEDVLKMLPLDFLEISVRDDTRKRMNRRPGPRE